MPKPNKYWYDQGYQIGAQFEGDPDEAPDPLSGEFAGQSIPEIFGDLATVNSEKDEQNLEGAMDAFEDGYWAAVYGNPGEIPLHESLAEIANWVDYEAEVVAKAAENVDDSSLQNEAEQQAEMMEDAAESLQDASEQAAETAAEIYNETAVPSTENPDPLVAGNPMSNYVMVTPNSMYTLTEQDYKDFVAAEEKYARGESAEHPLPSGWRIDVKGGETVMQGNPGDIPVVSDVAETAEGIVEDITPEPVQEKVQEQAVKEISDAPPEPADWLFRKRFAR